MSVQSYKATSRTGRRAAPLTVLLAISVLAPIGCWAGGGGSAGGRGGFGATERDARALAERRISMDEAVDLAQRRYNARVVRAEVAERDGRRVYVLRLLSEDGRVFNVRVDAATGSIQ